MLPNPTDSSVPAAKSSVGRRAIQRVYRKLQPIANRWGNCLESWARRVPLRFAVVAVTVLFAFVIMTMPPAFQTNDDAVMCMIVSGQGLTLAPDEHMVFTNVIIGKILKALYTNFPEMLWYGWYLVATQWIVTIAILYCFLSSGKTRLRLIGFSAYFFTAGIYFLVNLQFTSTANIAGIAGGLLLLQLIGHSQKSRREQTAIAIGAALLLVWGGLIRSDAFMLTVLLVGPALLVTYWLGSASRRAAVTACLSLSMAAGLMFFAERYHQDCYSDPNWQAFYQYNPLRIKFNDEQWVKYTPESKHVFDQVGWSKNDYEMIISWYFDDPLYDKEKLSSILNNYHWMLDRNLGKTLRSTLLDMWRQRTLRAVCFMLPAMLMFLDWRKRRYWPFAVSALTAVGLLLAIVVFRKAPPERVFMPVLAFPWLMLLYSMTPGWHAGEVHRRTLTRVFLATLSAWHVRNWSWRKPEWRQQLALRTISLLLVVGFSVSIAKHIRIGKAHLLDRIEYQKMLVDMQPSEEQAERLVMAFGGDFPFEYQAVLFGSNDYSGLHFYCIGWPQRTPFAERMKQYHHIESVGQALAEKHDMLLIVNSGAYGRIMEYLADHYNAALRMVNLKTYLRSSLSMIEPLVQVDFDSATPPTLYAKPHLESKGSRR